MYKYGQLLPASAPRAAEANAALLGTDTLGIEVTEANVAQRCGLGNIDPQHNQSGNGISAIEVALGWPLPETGVQLVTIRADLDSLGAMALLTLRAEGRLITPPIRARVAEVGRVDSFAWGAWPGPRPMPNSADDILADVGGLEICVLAAAMRDGRTDLSERVETARAWLLSGTLPAAYAVAPRERAEALWKALCDGRVVVREAVPGRLTEVISEVDGALQLGYRIAPVVVALNPRFTFPDRSVGRKYTIAQYQVGAVDLERAAAQLSELEPGWGGSGTIKGSPQGGGSRLELQEVSSAVVGALA
jgi:hypothetical protein